MSSTIDTSIFELQVKDDLSPAIKAWRKGLDAFEKDAKKFGKTIDEIFSSTFKDIKFDFADKFSSEFDKIKDIKPPLDPVVTRSRSILVNGFSDILSEITGLAMSAFGKIVDIGVSALSKVVSWGVNVVKSSITTYMSFEDQLALVGKTTSMAGKELEDFGARIRELAKPIGSLTAENLLQVAEVAGRLGISGADSIAAFSIEIGKGAIALSQYNKNTEKLAEHIASQQTIFKLTTNETKNMLSTLDALGKTTNSNELKIANFNLAMGQFNSQMKLSFEQSSGLGALLTASGMAANKAATQYGSAYTQLTTKSKALAAATKIITSGANGGAEAIRQLEAITGQSSASFSSLAEMIKYALGQDAFNTINLLAGEWGQLEVTTENFARGIDKAQLGTDAFGAVGLKTMSILAEGINAAAGEANHFDTILKTANESFLSGRSHIESFNAALSKTSEKIATFWSIIDSVKLVLGKPFVEAIGRVMERVNGLADEFSWFVTNSKAFAIALQDIVGWLEQIANIALDFVIEQFRNFVDYVEKDGISVWENSRVQVEEWGAKVNQAIQVAIVSVTEFFASLSNESASTNLTEIVSSLVSIVTAIGPVITAFSQVVDAVSLVTGSIAKSSQAVGELAERSGLVDAIAAAFNNIILVLDGIYEILTGDIIFGLREIAAAINDQLVAGMHLVWDTAASVALKIREEYLAVCEKIAHAIISEIGGALSAVGETISSTWNAIKSLVSDTTEEQQKSAESAENVANSIEKVEAAANNATQAVGNFGSAQQQVEEEGVTHSTWPAITEAITYAEQATDSLRGSIDGVANTLRQVEMASVRSLTNIKNATESANAEFRNFSVNDIQTSIPTVSRIGDTARTSVRTPESDASSTETAVTKKTATSKISKTSDINIVFSGTNVIDESSKNRLAKMISEAQQQLDASRVSV